MKTKDLETGVAYEYSTSNSSGFGSKGAMFVLSTDTYKTVRRPLPTELPFVPCPSGKAGYMEDAGVLVLLFRGMRWSEFAEQVRKVLSKVTLAQVEVAGMKIPQKVVDALVAIDASLYVELTVVLPRYLRGEWDELSAQYQRSVAEAKVVAEAAMVEAEARTAQWEELGQAIESMIGHKPWRFGTPTGHAVTISLKDLQAMVWAAPDA